MLWSRQLDGVGDEAGGISHDCSTTKACGAACNVLGARMQEEALALVGGVPSRRRAALFARAHFKKRAKFPHRNPTVRNFDLHSEAGLGSECACAPDQV